MLTHLSIPLVQNTRNLYFLSSHFFCCLTLCKIPGKRKYDNVILAEYNMFILCAICCSDHQEINIFLSFCSRKK